MLTGVSLFAGVGGFDLAMQRQGVKVVASVEIDPKCNEVLAKHFPEATQFTDVTTVKGEDLINAGFTPSTGIITGGFPCQDLSVAGKRTGLGGARSGLFWEICRLLDETRAQNFILENVPGLLSSNGGKDMAVVVEALVERGYRIAWRVLDAQHFGVPQRRRRVFIVGCLGNSGRSPEEILAIGESRAGYLEASRNKKKNLTSKLTNGTSKSNSESVIAYSLHGAMIGRKDTAGPMGSGFLGENKPGYTLTASSQARHGVVTIFHPHYYDGARIQDKTMNTLTSRMGTGGNNVSMVADESSVRRLTPVECERLQGFPDNWTNGQTDGHRYKQMGNAVAVPVVEWIIQNICDTI